MISESKNHIFFNIYQKSNPNFNIKISQKVIYAINKLYGDELIQFNSFITYLSQKNISTITQEKTMKKELDDNEANKIYEGLNNLGKYLIIPESLKNLDEDKQYEQAIKLPGKYITHIMKKAGIDFESMIYYLGLQIVSHEINENVVINYYLLESIFKLIPTLSIKFDNKNNFDITFYSFNKILKNCGIKLDEIIPFLHIDIKNIDRAELNSNNIPVYRAYQHRQIKNLITPELQNMNMDLMKGTDSLSRIKKNDFDNFDIFRNEQSNLLNDIINKIKIKKEEIKNIYENEDNNEALIKIYEENNKNEYILVSKEELKNKFNNEFNYIKQEGIFSGKGIKGEPRKLKGLFMKIQCEILPNLKSSILSTNKINNFNNDKNILVSSLKENNNKINNEFNNKEKLYRNRTEQDNIEYEYENMINPYDGIPFKQARTIKIEEDKNNNNNEIKLRNLPEREIKTYRIRRAILFKRPTETKTTDEKK